MCQNNKLIQQFVASILLVSSFLQGCGGNNPIIPQYTRAREIESNDSNRKAAFIEGNRQGLELDSSFKKGLLEKLPKGYTLGEAYGQGDCFFDALAQCLNQISPTSEHTAKSLRKACHNFYTANKDNEGLVDSWNETEAFGDFKGDAGKQRYLKILYDAEEMDSLFNHDIAIWGRPDIEGIMLCRQLNLEKFYLIEINKEHNPIETSFILQVIAKAEKECVTKDIEEAKELLTNCNVPILVVDKKSNHFVPLLRQQVVTQAIKQKESNVDKKGEVEENRFLAGHNNSSVQSFNLLPLRQLAFNNSIELLKSKISEEVVQVLDKENEINVDIANRLKAALASNADEKEEGQTSLPSVKERRNERSKKGKEDYIATYNDKKRLQEDCQKLKDINKSIDQLKGIGFNVKRNREVILKNLNNIGKLLHDISWNENNRKCIRNNHGYRNRHKGKGNNISKEGAKLDFETLSHLKDLNTEQLSTSVINHADLIKASLIILEQKVKDRKSVV